MAAEAVSAVEVVVAPVEVEEGFHPEVRRGRLGSSFGGMLTMASWIFRWARWIPGIGPSRYSHWYAYVYQLGQPRLIDFRIGDFRPRC